MEQLVLKNERIKSLSRINCIVSSGKKKLIDVFKQEQQQKSQILKSKDQVYTFKCLRIFMPNLVALHSPVFSQYHRFTHRSTFFNYIQINKQKKE